MQHPQPVCQIIRQGPPLGFFLNKILLGDFKELKVILNYPSLALLWLL